MVQVKADGAMSAILKPIKERAEVLDVEGKLMGIFIPAQSGAEILRQMAFADYESGAYQARRAAALASNERYTTEQVLERLQNLETP